MGQSQLAIAGTGRRHQLNRGQGLGNGIAQQGVFGHGKTVARRQWQHELIRIKSFHVTIVSKYQYTLFLERPF
jgi:hypothetical protein